MPEFYTGVILLINQSEEIGEKQLSVLGSRGGQISPFMPGVGHDGELIRLWETLPIFLKSLLNINCKI